MTRLCEGRVAIVTGAGRGIGREHSLELARQGAKVVVNDLGGATDGSGADTSPAQSVVDEIVAAGGQAVVNGDDVSDWNGAQRLIQQAVDTFGQLDVLVNNAGIIRDRTISSMSEAEWDAVIQVHLRGTFAPTRFAAAYWRTRAKETGAPVGGRIINTSSASGIFGKFGQSNYGAAKAGIAALTIIASQELVNYGVTVNAVAPAAVTRMTETSFPEDVVAQMGPEHIAPLVAWLASTDSARVTGRVFLAGGGKIGIAEGWRLGEEIQKDGLWTADELARAIPDLVSRARPNANMHGLIPA